MPGTTVRICEDTHETLQDLKRQTGEPMPDIVARAVDQFYRSLLIAETNCGYAALRDADTTIDELGMCSRDRWATASNSWPLAARSGWLSFDPVRGHEQGRQRLALIVSTNQFNSGPARLGRCRPVHDKGARADAAARAGRSAGRRPARDIMGSLSEAIRSISTDRLVGEQLGAPFPRAHSPASSTGSRRFSTCRVSPSARLRAERRDWLSRGVRTRVRGRAPCCTTRPAPDCLPSKARG